MWPSRCDERVQMNLSYVSVNCEAEKPFKLLHITDTHISFADGRDDERKNRLAEGRYRAFSGSDRRAERYFEESLSYAAKQGIKIIHTGDLIDFVSYANLDYARDMLKDTDYLIASGNHEFSLYVGEAFEDEAYREQSRELVQSAFRNDIDFTAEVINGVNLILIGDFYYRFPKRITERLCAELNRGLPTLLFMHTPLYEEGLYDYIMQGGAPCAYVTGAPEDKIAFYPRNRYIQQKPDIDTIECIELIKSHSNIKAIFAGHLHKPYAGVLDCGIPQYVTGIQTNGYALEITVK